MLSRSHFRSAFDHNDAGCEFYTVTARDTGRLVAAGFETYRAALDYVRGLIAAAHAAR